ncbi:MAG: maleylpyruvate isomerase family mycothiol-dependent enzyme [bacterium]
MSSLADRTIDALSDEHDTLAAAVRDVTDDQVTAPSGAAEWTVAQVLSHLGSGAEITLAGLQAALGERTAPDDDFNPSVWDRWNAMTPSRQRAGFLEHDAVLVAAFTALDQQQRETLELRVGFAPTPLTVASFAGMRLHEAAQHGWDVRAARDSAAGLRTDSARVLAELFSHDIAFLLGFIAKPHSATEPVLLDIADSGYGLSITDSVTVTSPVNDPTATFSGPLEAAIRLLAGRLGPNHTPSDLEITGNTTLDHLRTVFPGF